MKTFIGLTLLLLGLGATSAIAQPIDEEEKFDDALQQFGYVSGAAFQCSSSNQAQTIEKRVMTTFTGINRLFGSDRAFFYAAAYGAGATGSIDRSKCSQYIQQFQDALKQNSQKGE